MDTKQEILDIVSEYVEVPQNEIDTAAPLKFTAGIDSFVLMSMMAAIEEHFNVRIPVAELPAIKTIDDIVASVDRLR